MDYDGSSFKSAWKNGLLRIRCYRVEENALGLLGIVLDAALKQGEFRIAWDLRMLERPSIFQMYEIVRFCFAWETKLNRRATKMSILTVPNKEYVVNYIFKILPPSYPHYVGSDVSEAKRFVDAHI